MDYRRPGDHPCRVASAGARKGGIADDTSRAAISSTSDCRNAPSPWAAADMLSTLRPKYEQGIVENAEVLVRCSYMRDRGDRSLLFHRRTTEQPTPLPTRGPTCVHESLPVPWSSCTDLQAFLI